MYVFTRVRVCARVCVYACMCLRVCARARGVPHVRLFVHLFELFD